MCIVVHVKRLAILHSVAVICGKRIKLRKGMSFDEFLQAGIIATGENIFNESFYGIGRKAFDKCVKTAILAVMLPHHLVKQATYTFLKFLIVRVLLTRSRNLEELFSQPIIDVRLQASCFGSRTLDNFLGELHLQILAYKRI